MRVSLKWMAFCFTAVFIAGCSNPADNVPEAQVQGSGESASMASEADGAVYVIAPESKIEFVGSKVTGSHDGGFNAFSGQFTLVDGAPEGSRGEVEIDVDSMWSDNDRLTGHLKSPDFFNVEQFPTSTFKATKIEAADDGYTITGDLTLHGVTQTISFPAQVEVSDDQIALKAEFFINRFDFDMKYPGRADDLIRKEVVIKLDIVARPEAA